MSYINLKSFELLANTVGEGRLPDEGPVCARLAGAAYGWQSLLILDGLRRGKIDGDPPLVEWNCRSHEA